ncbi:MAG: DUF1540 domain-containing protein [Clostridia bacterium]|nr:DUF1540 domain-containing protein [Clostridia bacterium]
MLDCNSTESCVRCSVKNCIHHSNENTCEAGCISVGNSTACSCSETCCDTFKARD